ncbi:MAG TPA: GNAT family N-acetyltransferase, partial [Symbiobacteriaceae bacterium]|nr:GNAT family N-acetyltransferase [Symbiobacteriaceae bacterium]
GARLVKPIHPCTESDVPQLQRLLGPLAEHVDPASSLCFVADGCDGRPAGYAVATPRLYGQPLQPGQYFLFVTVAPESRRQGLGGDLFALCLAQARAAGAEAVLTMADEADPAAYRFATRRGFYISYQMVRMELDLAKVDLRVLDRAEAEARARGVRISDLSGLADPDDAIGQLYSLDTELSKDVPEWSGVMPPLAEYRESLLSGDLTGVLLAWQHGELVGMAMSGPDQEGAAYTSFLGVKPEYRRMGIARALKVHTIRWALARGFDRLVTDNNTASNGIISLNRKLGYQVRSVASYLLRDLNAPRFPARSLAFTGATLAVFMWLYAWWQGWWFGAGMGLIMLAHEVGHMVAGRWRGVRMSLPTFVPFVGAFVSWKGRPRRVADEVVLAAGGPALGLLAGGLAALAGAMFDVVELMRVAYLGFALHLLNLLPVLPLDGGRMVTGISRWICVVALPLLVYFTFDQQLGFFFGIVGGASLQALQLDPMDIYYRASASRRAQALLTYLVLLAATLGGLLWTSAPSGFGEVLPTYLYDGGPLWDPFNFWLTAAVTVAYLIYRFGRPMWSRSRPAAAE